MTTPSSNLNANQEPIKVFVHLSSSYVSIIAGRVLKKANGIVLQIEQAATVRCDAFLGGEVGNIEHLYSAIHNAFSKINDIAIYSFYLSFASANMAFHGCSGSVRMPVDDQGVAKKIEQIDLLEARTKASEDFHQKHPDRHALQMYVQAVTLDNGEFTLEPIGRNSNQMTVHYDTVSLSHNQYAEVQNLFQVASGTGQKEIHDIFFDGVSGSYYALKDEQKDQGVCYIDIGHGTTKVCVYVQGVLVHNNCLRVGGQDVTKDIAVEMKLSYAESERLKLNHATLDIDDGHKAHFIPLNDRSHESSMVHAHLLNQVVLARYEQILGLVVKSLEQENLLGVVKSVVLAGGASKMSGLPKLTKKTFGVPSQMMSRNDKISIEYRCPYMDANELAQFKSGVESGKFHSILGAMAYEQSINYQLERKDLENLSGGEANGFFGQMHFRFKKFFEWVVRSS